MKIRVERNRLYALFAILTVTLIGSGIFAVRSGNHALESVLVACQRMWFLFGDRLSIGSAISITLLVLLVSGIANAIWGFVWDTLKLYVLERKAMCGATVLTDEESTIYLTNDIPHQAWTSGIFKSRIYVSSESYDRLSERARKALIAHEMAHVENHDVLKRVIANGLRRIFWYVPIISEAVEIMRFAQEVRADRMAMKTAGKRALCDLYISASGKSAPAHASGFAFATPRLTEVLEGKSLKVELSTSRLLVSLLMTSFVVFGGLNGIVSEVHAEAPATCAIIETMAPQSFTPLLGPLELHTSLPENACNENLSC